MITQRSGPIEEVCVRLQDPCGVETVVSDDGQCLDRELFAAKVELAVQEAGVWVCHRVTMGDLQIVSETPWQVDEDLIRLAELYSQDVTGVNVSCRGFKRIEFELPFDADIEERLQMFLDGLSITGYGLSQVDFYSDPMNENTHAGVLARDGNAITAAGVSRQMSKLNFSGDAIIHFELVFTTDTTCVVATYKSGVTFLRDLNRLNDTLLLFDETPTADDTPERVYVSLKLASSGQTVSLPVLASNISAFVEYVCEWRSTGFGV